MSLFTQRREGRFSDEGTSALRRSQKFLRRGYTFFRANTIAPLNASGYEEAPGVVN